jgi:hypothetical protein
MVVRKRFRIAFAFALLVKTHGIASHHFCIAFAFCIRIALLAFFAFSHFFHGFGRCVMVIEPKTCEKCKKNAEKSGIKSAKMRKMCENAKKCEMRMQCKKKN